jgi:hypothetical protein
MAPAPAPAAAARHSLRLLLPCLLLLLGALPPVRSPLSVLLLLGALPLVGPSLAVSLLLRALSSLSQPYVMRGAFSVFSCAIHTCSSSQNSSVQQRHGGQQQAHQPIIKTCSSAYQRASSQRNAHAACHTLFHGATR